MSLPPDQGHVCCMLKKKEVNLTKKNRRPTMQKAAAASCHQWHSMGDQGFVSHVVVGSRERVTGAHCQYGLQIKRSV